MQPLLLNQFVGKAVLLKFKLDISRDPEPGKLERFTVWGANHEAAQDFYKLLVTAMMSAADGRTKPVILPKVFAAEDVLWISEGPIDVEGGQIVTPDNGQQRTASGLVVPR